MKSTTRLTALAAACAGALLASCSEAPTTSTAHADAKLTSARSLQPTELASRDVAGALPGALPDAFTVRAPLDPYFINQAPDLMLRSRVRSDLAVQRLVTPPGPGGWHTHPGPSFGIVQQGRVVITRYSRTEGCTTEEYGPGETYYEVAGQVHRASVEGPEPAVEYKVRFNTPIGEPFANQADDPGC
jgi:hypothetical protein